MYEGYYGFEKAPFRVTPDPEFLYLSPSHKEALAAIIYGVEERKGFIVVLGEVGLGKTTILRTYLDRIDQKQLSVAYVLNADVPFKALLDIILQDLGIQYRPDVVPEMVNLLHQVALEEHRQGRNLVLVVDEAQNMPVETLESLRMLSNLETATEKLLQIVLVGQPEFAEKLELRELRQLKQRVAVRATLLPFSDEESLAYIQHRLDKAGVSDSSVLFTQGALRLIVRHARGIPRTLNILCDNALVTGLGYQKKPVTAAIVREVVGDLEGKPRPHAHHRWAWASLAVFLAAGALFLASPYRDALLPGQDVEISVPPVPPAPGKPGPAPFQSRVPPVDLETEGVLADVVPPAPVAPPGSDAAFVDTRVVRKGDGLLRMARDVYGFADTRVIQRIVESNPGIKDVDRIPVGTLIRFPDVSDLRGRAQGPPSQGQ